MALGGRRGKIGHSIFREHDEIGSGVSSSKKIARLLAGTLTLWRLQEIFILVLRIGL
jgi:hypothetical protein